MIEASRIKQLLLFGLLSVLTYAAYEKYFSKESTPQFEPFTKGYALEGVIIQSTDETGRIITTIKSPAVIHYADTEKTMIEQPDITLHQAAGDWLFRSELGEINPEQTEIYFPHEVQIDLQGVKSQNNQIQMVTKELTVDVLKKTGLTPAFLKMSQLDSIIQGVGAVVNFQQQEIDILSEMYAEFKN